MLARPTSIAGVVADTAGWSASTRTRGVLAHGAVFRASTDRSARRARHLSAAAAISPNSADTSLAARSNAAALIGLGSPAPGATTTRERAAVWDLDLVFLRGMSESLGSRDRRCDANRRWRAVRGWRAGLRTGESCGSRAPPAVNCGHALQSPGMKNAPSIGRWARCAP